jgi:hypothetical protein
VARRISLFRGDIYVKRLFAAGLILSIAVFGQTGSQFPVSFNNGHWIVKPNAVPTSATVVVATDAYLQSLTVSNPTGGVINFSLCDRQVSPVCVLPVVPISNCTATTSCVYVIGWPDSYWCPGGFTVLGSGSGLTFSVSWRQP